MMMDEVYNSEKKDNLTRKLNMVAENPGGEGGRKANGGKSYRKGKESEEEGKGNTICKEGEDKKKDERKMKERI